MDSLHDLGGKEGFGPIPIKSGDAGFSHEWERRMWALNLNLRGNTGSIDWFRHGLELMVPKDYITYAYFHKWCANILMLLIDAGYFTVEDAAKAAKNLRNQDPTGKAPSVTELLENYRIRNTDFTVTLDTLPRFALGDAVQTKRFAHSGHSRLPAYARNRQGKVITYHGAHLLADDGAKGNHLGEHLYTVSFAAPELWGLDADPRDTVTLELWESYFV
ncbi:Low-molecular weight cobalt-containing nitrile hydratase subunit beta [Roseovarius albus]|uniref:nitrile hydratase n=1 Tax=Roseovarius albus TaxID=1247867 RepID=A0A1X6YR10_9RHOB|nr:nitrile hydratase subunit beta [Roseovarius albus]SLN28563.1 Low-molecular weight cobalt-containing nitrile hydratase subunit beta [Roseovarius albus]